MQKAIAVNITKETAGLENRWPRIQDNVELHLIGLQLQAREMEMCQQWSSAATIGTDYDVFTATKYH